MMRIFAIFLVVILCSCDKGAPDDILPKDKMENVLWDMMRADEFLNSYVLRDTSLNRKTASFEMYEKVFHVHNITKEEFQKNLHYYQQHPKMLQPILDSLEVRVNRPVENIIPIDTTAPGINRGLKLKTQ